MKNIIVIAFFVSASKHARRAHMHGKPHIQRLCCLHCDADVQTRVIAQLLVGLLFQSRCRHARTS